MLKFINTAKTAASFKDGCFFLSSAEDWASIGDGPTRGAVLAWLAKGNTPAPADTPDPKQIAQGKISMIESQNMLPRVVREYLLADFADKAVKAGLDPMLLPAYAKLKALDDQIKALRAQL